MTLVKASFTNLITNESIPVMFNPPSYEFSKSNSWADQRTRGNDTPGYFEFQGGKAADLSIDLFFDTHMTGRRRPQEVHQRNLEARARRWLNQGPCYGQGLAAHLRVSLGPGVVVQGRRRERDAEVHAVPRRRHAHACRGEVRAPPDGGRRLLSGPEPDFRRHGRPPSSRRPGARNARHHRRQRVRRIEVLATYRARQRDRRPAPLKAGTRLSLPPLR